MNASQLKTLAEESTNFLLVDLEAFNEIKHFSSFKTVRYENEFIVENSMYFAFDFFLKSIFKYNQKILISTVFGLEIQVSTLFFSR